jgi:hypothetical protein
MAKAIPAISSNDSFWKFANPVRPEWMYQLSLGYSQSVAPSIF